MVVGFAGIGLSDIAPSLAMRASAIQSSIEKAINEPLVPAIYVLLAETRQRRGCPGQARA
jgi:hypothetical protein